MKYSKEDILLAAEYGEVSMIDAKHIVSLLDELPNIKTKCFNCVFYKKPFRCITLEELDPTNILCTFHKISKN